MGDWGLQMGLIIAELQERQPELPYFDESFQGEYPKEAPFTISQLEEIYPFASAKSKENEEFAKMIGESLEDFSTMLFQREIMHTVSTLYDVSETLRSYVQDPQAAQNHMRAILKLYNL